MKIKELSSDRAGIFAGDNPFDLARHWLAQARESEPNDPDAVALATADKNGLPDVRMVLLKEIRDDGFVFFTNYTSAKADELAQNAQAAFVMHWKSLRRQIRVRGSVEKVNAAASDAYFGTRSVFSRVGAWASDQSAPLDNRGILQARSEALTKELGDDPARPPHWGGYVIRPQQIEFWADGEARLHDRFRWTKGTAGVDWDVERLNP